MDEREEANGFIKSRNSKNVPFLNLILTTRAKIRDVKELDSINSGEYLQKIMNSFTSERSVSNKDNLCFSYYSPLDAFCYIFVNFDQIEETNLSNPEFYSFLYLHQIVHHYFGHYTRTSIQKWKEKNSRVVELILDAQVNTFLIKALHYQEAKNVYNKATYQIIKRDYATYDSLYAFAQEKYGITPNFDLIRDFVAVEQVLKQLEPMINDKTLTDEELQSIGHSLDDHDLSQQGAQEIAQQARRSLEELARIQNDSFTYLEEVAKQQGITSSDASQRQIEAEKTKKSVLELLKIEKTLKDASKLKYKKTWQRLSRRREYLDDIGMPGKTPLFKKYIVVGRFMPFMGEVR